MSVNLWQASWPLESTGQAIQALAAQEKLPLRPQPLPAAPSGSLLEEKPDACRRWIESIAANAGLEATWTPVSFGAMDEILGQGVSLLKISFDGRSRLLAVVGTGDGKLTLLPPSLDSVSVPLSKLTDAIGNILGAQVQDRFEGVLDGIGLSESRRHRVLRSMIEERVENVIVAEVWKLDHPPSANLWTHASRAGLPGKLAAFLSAYGAEYGLWILSWVLVGKWAMEGRFDSGWLLAWALLLLTLIPLHMLAMWEEARLAVSGAAMVMKLLLEGSFKLRPEEVRCTGVGQILARVLDCEALQSLALNGGLLALIALVELVVSMAVLAIGAHAWSIAFLLLLWTSLATGLALVYHHRRRDWTTARLNVTEELTERMVGHRTRSIQQSADHWHDSEDEALAHYVRKSKGMDWLSTICLAVVPRGWLVLGIAAMAPAIIGETQTAGIIAARLGGVLLSYNALRKLGFAAANLSTAAIAADRAKDVLNAARRIESSGDPALAATASEEQDALLEMRNVTFRYPQRAVDAVKNSSVKFGPNDRVLLQGASGSGKSTWVALASGIRLPDSGLLFLGGIDRKTLGERDWRKRVVAAPQFHENHIFSGSLAFNLLLGRRWPAQPEDLAESESVCRELGLGPLLDSMPGGLMQVVGETGWQLSNGEKSRIYLARTLLQRADLVILDETLGALDPETAHMAMSCILRRAKTLVCVAHA